MQISLEQAASILNVSPEWAQTKLDEGCFTLTLQSVEEYLKEDTLRRYKILDELVKLTEDLGLYEQQDVD